MTAWRSNVGSVSRQMARATDAGLVAAAQVPLNAVKRRLVRGYTSGAFAQGARGMLGLIARTDPVTEHGVRVIRIGVQYLATPYPLYWELGHQNRFTRRYERQEVFRPALVDNAMEIRRVFATVYARAMQGGGGPPGPAMDMAAD